MNDKLSLSELQKIIKDSLYMALPDMYWVIAEIAEIKENYAGHCYIELVEKLPDESNLRARIRAVIWSKRYSFLKPLFESVTGESLREGFKVLLRVTVEYHEVYGISLVINDIDPAFTIGEMAVRRQEIIRRLEKEGVFAMNKGHDFPKLPKRIAVVSSKNAAGYSDFLKHLAGNSYGYSFNTALFDASMQGTDTEKSVINALDRVSEHIELFDTVVVIRGGGSQTDLSWFDNYNIAFHITQFPLPVLTGIGHEKDMTITDMVAFNSLKTPTAVADYIITTFVETDTQLAELGRSISDLSISLILKYRELIDDYRIKLIPLASSRVADVKKKLASEILTMITRGREFLIRQEILPASSGSRLRAAVKTYTNWQDKRLTGYLSDLRDKSLSQTTSSGARIETLNSNLLMLDPENVLKRGYSMTSMNGCIVKSAAALKPGDMIKTKFADGYASSEVKDNKNM
jgi:exodeoxyribonuclease VII large subunit